jgi:hypothetical protein
VNLQCNMAQRIQTVNQQTCKTVDWSHQVFCPTQTGPATKSRVDLLGRSGFNNYGINIIIGPV